MKLIFTVLQAEDAAATTQALIETGFRVTRIATEGGWLRKQNTSLLIGTDDEKVDKVIQILGKTCQHRTVATSSVLGAILPNLSSNVVEVGGATVFVLEVDQFRHF